MVTGSQKHWGHYTVTGMRDPLAADPAQVAAEFGIAPGSLEAHFEPYQSLDPRFSRPREFESEKQQLEQQMVLFPVNSSALMPDQGMRLDAIEDHINRLQEIAGELGRQIHITIYGRADQTGAETKNAALSKERAQRVLEALRERGIPPDMITAVGLGDSEPIRHGSPSYQLEVNRSVSLKVQSQHQGDKQ